MEIRKWERNGVTLRRMEEDLYLMMFVTTMNIISKLYLELRQRYGFSMSDYWLIRRAYGEGVITKAEYTLLRRYKNV